MKPTVLAGIVACCVVAGCGGSIIRSQEPEPDALPGTYDEDMPGVRTIGHMTSINGLQPLMVQGVGLVVGLDRTGSDAPPSPARSVVARELRRRGIENPNALIASPSTALVLVHGYVPPAAREGDRFDVEVEVYPGTSTTSLRGGTLLPTSLAYIAIGIDAEGVGQVLEGLDQATAEGPLMVVGQPNEETGVPQKGRVLGGGRISLPRPLQLVILPEFQNVRTSMRIGERINQRFYSYRAGVQEGAATPKTDDYIELIVDPRYRHNLPRYLHVIRHMALGQTPSRQREWIVQLEQMLNDPATARRAALHLEGIGPDAVPVLKRALQSPDLEVKFYAAEALAYMGERDAAAVLHDYARNQPAFRVFALTALASLDEAICHRLLSDLMNETSAETRYGAFRALWAMDKNDPFIRGENLHGALWLHDLDTQGPPMIHFTRSSRPEVVLFGRQILFHAPMMAQAGPNILVQAAPDSTEVRVTRFMLGRDPVRRTCSPRVAEVIRTVIEVGGAYPDVVDLLYHAQEQGNLDCRLAVDALPQAGRVYDRRVARQGEAAAEPARHDAEAPLPNLFEQVQSSDQDDPEPEQTAAPTDTSSADFAAEDPSDQPAPEASVFGTLFGR